MTKSIFCALLFASLVVVSPASMAQTKPEEGRVTIQTNDTQPVAGTVSDTPAQPASNSTGMSTGAKAGIGVGAFFGAALIGVLCWIGCTSRDSGTRCVACGAAGCLLGSMGRR
jgi:hypothetical protein